MWKVVQIKIEIEFLLAFILVNPKLFETALSEF